MKKPRLSQAEKRDLVLEYLCVPFGQRKEFLDRHDVSPDTFRHWRRQVMTGALETGLIPRGGSWVSADENRELARLYVENKRLQAELDKARTRLETQERTVDVLGKAIESLRDGNTRQRRGSDRA